MASRIVAAHVRICTVTCFVLHEGRVLLQERPAGKLWSGMLNGPGGKIEAGEAADEAVIREMLEETGLQIVRPERRGSLALVIPTPQRTALTVDVFVATRFEGEPVPREGALSWHPSGALPFHRMWVDQKYWLPAVLDGCSVHGSLAYESDTLCLAQCELQLRLTPPERCALECSQRE